MADLESHLQSQLADAWVTDRLQSAKVSGRAEPREISRRSAFVKVYAVKDIEELGSEQQCGAFREPEILGQSHVPTVGAGETKAPLSDVAEGAGSVWSERSRVQPIPAGTCNACFRTGSSAVRVTDQIGAVLPYTCAGTIHPRYHNKRPARLCGD